MGFKAQGLGIGQDIKGDSNCCPFAFLRSAILETTTEPCFGGFTGQTFRSFWYKLDWKTTQDNDMAWNGQDRQFLSAVIGSVGDISLLSNLGPTPSLN